MKKATRAENLESLKIDIINAQTGICQAHQFIPDHNLEEDFEDIHDKLTDMEAQLEEMEATIQNEIDNHIDVDKIRESAERAHEYMYDIKDRLTKKQINVMFGSRSYEILEEAREIINKMTVIEDYTEYLQ